MPVVGTSADLVYGNADLSEHATGAAAPSKKVTGRIGDIMLLSAMLAVAVFSLQNIARVPSIVDDEGTYTAQAWAVLSGSLSPYTYFYDHPPLGWIQLAPMLWASQHFGWADSAIVSARLGSGLALLADVVLLYLMVQRLGSGKLIAAGSTAVLSLSPLASARMHLVYLDNLALPWILAAFVVALSPQQSRRQHLLSGVLLAVATLTKESAILMYPALLCLLLSRARQGMRRSTAIANLLGLCCIAGLYPLYALVTGDLLVMVKSVAWQLITRSGSGSLTDTGSNRYLIVDEWLRLDPALLIVGLLAGGTLLFLKNRFSCMGLTLLIPFLACVKPGGYLPPMFVILALPFLIACSVLVFTHFAAACSRRLAGRRRLGIDVIRHAGIFLITAILSATAFYVLQDRAGSDDAVSPDIAVASWVANNLPEEATVVVDDAIFAELYVGGRTNVWRNLFVYRLDFPQSQAAYVPRGWQYVDFVVVTPKMRSAIGNPAAVEARAAVEHGNVVFSFGSAVVVRVRPPA